MHQSFDNPDEVTTDESNMLGAGSYGSVFAAKHHDDVVVKQASPGAEVDLLQEERAYNQLLRMLGCKRNGNSPCCEHFGYAVLRGQDLLIRPRGQSLESWIKSVGDTNGCEKNFCSFLQILDDLFTAVTCLHNKALSHGDLKPANVIVHCQSKHSRPRFVAVLIDMASLRHFGDYGFNLSTADKERMGTVKYQSQKRREALRKHVVLGDQYYNPVHDDIVALAQTVIDVVAVWTKAHPVSRSEPSLAEFTRHIHVLLDHQDGDFEAQFQAAWAQLRVLLAKAKCQHKFDELFRQPSTKYEGDNLWPFPKRLWMNGYPKMFERRPHPSAPAAHAAPAAPVAHAAPAAPVAHAAPAAPAAPTAPGASRSRPRVQIQEPRRNSFRSLSSRFKGTSSRSNEAFPSAEQVKHHDAIARRAMASTLLSPHVSYM